MIRHARPAELPAIREVQASALQSLVELGVRQPQRGKKWKFTNDDHFQKAIDEQRARVFIGLGGKIDGFYMWDVIDGELLFEEADVRYELQEQGIGSYLFDDFEAVAREKGLESLVLTTFSEVPFNQRWYEKLGFKVINFEDCGPELAAQCLIELEAVNAKKMGARVAMRKTLGADRAISLEV